MSYPATVKFLPDLTIYIFYLATQMDRSEYVRIKINDILTEVIDEYNLQAITQNVWVYFEIVRGCYGLTQSGKLVNYLLRTRLNKAGYYETATTPGLWEHTWSPIQFSLIVDDFGIKYVGEKNSQHLLQVLQEHYEISKDWKGENFTGIDLKWNYSTTKNDRTLRLSIHGYIDRIIIQFGHKRTTKPQI